MFKLITLMSLLSPLALPCTTQTSLENEYASIATVAEHLTADRSIASEDSSNEAEKEKTAVIDNRVSYDEFIEEERKKFGDSFDPSAFPKDNIAKVQIVYVDPNTHEEVVLANASGILIGNGHVLTSKHIFARYLDFYAQNGIVFNGDRLAINDTVPVLDKEKYDFQHRVRDRYEELIQEASRQTNNDLQEIVDANPDLFRLRSRSHVFQNTKVVFKFGYENGKFKEKRVGVKELAGEGFFRQRPDYKANPETRKKDNQIREHLMAFNTDNRFGDWTIIELDKPISSITPIAVPSGATGSYHPEHFETLPGAQIGYVTASFYGDKNGGNSISYSEIKDFSKFPSSENVFLETNVLSASGASGGPLFARAINPETKKIEYHLVAIQTGISDTELKVVENSQRVSVGQLYLTNITDYIYDNFLGPIIE